MKIESHVESVSKVIAAHESILTDAAKKSAAEREELAARQAADAEKLTPIVEAAANLKNKLTALTSASDELAEQLRIGRHQLTQQNPLVEEFDGLVSRNFGNFHAEKNPGVFMELLENRPACFIALQIVPRLKAWIAAKEDELEETESQIATLAQTAKPPAK